MSFAASWAILSARSITVGIIESGITNMVHQARDLSPEQKAAAELLLGRPLDEQESISVQAFRQPTLSEDRRREVAARLEELFTKANRSLEGASEEEGEEIFTEAMRTSRPNFQTQR
jgi:hypothetical protein